MPVPASQSHGWHTKWRNSAERGGWLSWVLWPFSLIYRLLVAGRHWGYRLGWLAAEPMPVPVIVVGNVVAGGAGKTPTTIELVRHLRLKGWHPGVVSRGYGRHELEANLPVTPESDPAQCGDEPLLIATRTAAPVFVGAERPAAARALLAAHPGVNIIVCDDGLQHYALHRDVSIVVFDDRGIGNGMLLPAGLLREPWPPASRSPYAPDLALVQRRDAMPGIDILAIGGIAAYQASRTLSNVAISANGTVQALASMTSQDIIAVAGIARPEVFFDMLEGAGVHIKQRHPLPDHASASEYAAVLELPAESHVLCTEKDAVKLNALARARDLKGAAHPTIWSVGLQLSIAPDFFEALDDKLRSLTRFPQ
ncbi:tetraacyldisaccharide 4'-kinase [Hydrogenophaga sp. 5NK40-0174]|uniref:tetraacyldisaccharide 4'-kinase n=1 Tax=Hydrogenophaga sp. 5NK40-0174 TaxID=3127649 RepID=UPI00310B4573